MTRNHPYVVEPYDAIVSPLLDPLGEAEAGGVTGFLGLASVIEQSARAELTAARETRKSLAGYLKYIWDQRPKSGTAHPEWKPYHHAEANPPISQAAPMATITKLPVRKKP